MRRGAKPAKAKVEAKPPIARKPRKTEGSRVHDLEKHLAEALKREAEALEQQTATAEILRVISNSPTDAQPVFEAVLASAARLCDALDATMFRVDGDVLRLVAHEGPIPSHPVGTTRLLTPAFPSARAVLEGRTIHIADIQADVGEYPEGGASARDLNFRTVLIVPLMREGAALGAIAIRRTEVRPFNARQAELLKTFADQAVIAIENVRLFRALEARNRDLTATSEILRVISSSPTDVEPVFEAIAASARRLCDATQGSVQTYDGSLVYQATTDRVKPEGAESLRQAFPMAPSRASASTRAILYREVIRIPDVLEDPEYVLAPAAQAAGFRSVVSVPMLREGTAIGAVTRHEGGARLFLRESGRVVEDVRRSGRDRHRERAAV
jgi:GAF domain-containing protein